MKEARRQAHHQGRYTLNNVLIGGEDYLIDGCYRKDRYRVDCWLSFSYNNKYDESDPGECSYRLVIRATGRGHGRIATTFRNDTCPD